MKLRLSLKLFAVILFYLFIALMVVAFSASFGIYTYPLIILASFLFILALRLNVRLNGFLIGIIAAVLAMGLVIVVLALSGAIQIGAPRDNYVYYLLTGVIIQLFVAFGEELSFRAAILQGLYEELGLWPAVLLSAAGFALLHLPSMGLVGIGAASDVVALATIFLAGITLGLLYAYGGLFNAIAFHFTWNFIEYDLFNLGPLDGAINVTKPGTDLMTGGSFGPEASVVGLAVVTLLAIAVWYYYNRIKKRKDAQDLSSKPR